jgi:glycosyltransferase involved in cell wall biosynthesis
VKICLVIANFWPGWGGAERQCGLLARTLARLGYEVAILTRGRRGLPREEKIEGVSVRRTAAFGPGTLRSLVWTLTATAWLRRQGRRFQIAQCYQLLSPSHVGILAHRSGGHATIMRPACSGPFGDIAEVRRLPLTNIRKRLLRRADAFVTLTEDIETELVEFGLGGVPFHRIPNGVDAALFSPVSPGEQAALRAALGLPTDRVLCAFVGRLTRQKNPNLLLEAWSRCERSQAHLVFVGDGPLRADLEQRNSRLPSARRASFTGAVQEITSFVRAMDLLVLPSQAEGISNSMLEAMACGLPVVATDVGGARDVLGDDGKAGLVVPVGSSAALAEAITALADSPALRREIGAAARTVIEDRYDMKRVVAQYLSLYADLVG